MIGSGKTYFNDINCMDNPHFLLYGHVNDRFCNNLLQITGLEEELVYHLKENGFDAVFFMDYTSVIYCRDAASYRVLVNGRNPVQGAGTAAGQNGRSSSLRRRNRNQGGQPVQTEENNQKPDRYYFDRMDFNIAWASAGRMLFSDEVRCALVITNVSSMSVDMRTEALELLMNLSASRKTNRSIVIYIFRDLKDISRNYNAMNANQMWGEFYRSVIEPSLVPETGGSGAPNRLIKIGSPGAGEIRNLLYSMRSSGEVRLRISPLNVEAVAVSLAKYVGYKDYQLDRLILLLTEFTVNHPEMELTPDNLEILLGEKIKESPLERLEKMIGLEDVGEEYRQQSGKKGKALKPALREWVASMRYRASHKQNPENSISRLTPLPGQDKSIGFSLNAVLEGNPGTGKSDILKMFGEIYYDLGLLPSPHYEELTVEQLMQNGDRGGANALHAAILGAMGGVLIIDEAYQIYDRSHELALECMNQLVTDTAAYKGEVAVVMGGYEEGMETLMNLNPGLASRFPNIFYLPDYTPAQMRQIFNLMMAKKDNPAVRIDPSQDAEFDNFFQNWVEAKAVNWGNGRENEILLNELITAAITRISREKNPGNLIELRIEDIPEDRQLYTVSREQSLDQVMREIDEMIGLHEVKRYLHTLVRNITTKSVQPVPGNYLFIGPPGTGKTVTARKMVDLLYKLKLIKRRYIKEVTAKELVEAYNARRLGNGIDNQSSQEITRTNGRLTIQEIVKIAKGGVVFIDEAHQLKDTPEGQAVIRELVPLIERPDIHGTTAFILAGYTHEMNDLLTHDDGLKRRFPDRTRIYFDGYSADELSQILRNMAKDANQIIPDDSDYIDRARAVLSEFLEINNDPNFGNGGYIRDTFLPESIDSRASRLEREYLTDSSLSMDEKARIIDSLDASIRNTLTGADIPERFSGYASARMPIIPRERNIETLTQNLIGKDEIVRFIREKQSSANAKENFVDTRTNNSMHCTIAGPVGSGHHTVAKVLATLWKSLGKLRNDMPLYRGKGNFEAGYVGQTAGKTAEVIQTALGGTLVVMYPSSMLPNNANDNSFGPEALGTIESYMISHVDDLSVIFIDSEDGMKRFLASRPSVQSMLAAQFVLEDFTPNEMMQIFCGKTAASMVFEPALKELMEDFMVNWVSERGGLGENVSSWGNGSEIDQLIEGIRSAWEADPHHETRTGEDGITRRVITCSMIPEKYTNYLKKTSALSDTAMKELNDMIGLTGVKRAVENIVISKKWSRRGNGYPGNYCFLGNPGVGKTTVARLMGGILKAANALQQGHVIVRTAKEICNQQAYNPKAFSTLMKTAKNGILFIDEAHELVSTNIGQDIIRRLLQVTEDREFTSTTSVILAGYPKEMNIMLSQDSGLMSRFGTDDSIIIFEDYTPEELVEIARYQASHIEKYPQIGAAGKLTLTEEFLKKSLDIFREIVKLKNFGNARFIRNYLHDAVMELYRRLEQKNQGPEDIPEQVITTLTGKDIPTRYRNMVKNNLVPARIENSLISTSPVEGFTDENFARRCDTLSRGIVYIQILDDMGGFKGEATGFLVTPYGHILTCHHVVEGSRKFRVRLRIPGMIGGAIRWFDAVAMEPAYEDCDMGMIKIDGVTDMPYLSLADEGTMLRQGQKIAMIGYPLGSRPNQGNADTLTPSAFHGMISSQQTRSNGIQVMYVNMEGKSGNSGSPVFDYVTGRVVGVFAGSVTGESGKLVEEINYFYSIQYFYDRFVRKNIKTADSTEKGEQGT